MNRPIIPRILPSVFALLLLVNGCATRPDGEFGYQSTTLGTIGGAAIGAGIGALAGGKTHRGRNAAIGGLSGAVVGGGIGLYMDRQAAELRKNLPEAEVVRDGDKVYVALPSGVLFDLGKDSLKSASIDSLSRAAETIKKSETNIIIQGHTDSTGTDAINQPLSERRARRVFDFLAARGVLPSRMSAVGYGSSRPAVPNDTEANRALNRRVQLEISPNKKAREEYGSN